MAWRLPTIVSMIINRKLIKGVFFFVLFFSLPFRESCGGTSLFSQSVGGTTSGAVSYCTTLNSGVVSVSAFVGTILNWQSTTDGGQTWNNNINSTANQTYFNLNQTTCYRAIVKDGAFPPDTSTVVCITIYPPSIGGTLSGGGTFCDSSGAGTLTLSGSTGDIVYWLSSIDNGSTWQTISNTTVTENYSNIIQSTLYHAVVQSDPGCPTDTSSQASFVIDPLTMPGTIDSDSVVCASDNSGNLTLSGYIGTILGWESSINNGTSWFPVSNNAPVQSYLNISQTTWYRAILKSGTCNDDTTLNFIINVSSPSVAGTLSGGGIYCGVPATGTLTLTGQTGNIIGWASSLDNGFTWTNITNTSTTEAYSNLAVTTWYAAIVQSEACPSDTSNTEIVSVAPQTVAGIISGNSIACLGANLDTLILSGNVGTVTGWISSINNGLTWDSVANTTTSQINDGLTQTTMFAAIVQSGACNIDTTASVTISVVSAPVADAGGDLSITQGQSVHLNGTGTGTGTPLWLPAASLNNPALFAPTANPNSSTTYVLTVTDSNGCKSADTVFVIVTMSVFKGMVSNLFSPNGDGINDSWYIEGIENFSENEVFIYTIYGKEVYTAKGYSNDWQGTFNGSELPDGTYYYVIRFDNSEKVLKGAIDLLRSK